MPSEDKKFIQVDTSGTTIREYHSRNPRGAALKAATRDEPLIVILDAQVGKIHIFKGIREPLTDAQRNSFTEANNIQTRPQVHKMAYTSLKQPINVKNDKKILEDVIHKLINE